MRSYRSGHHSLAAALAVIIVAASGCGGQDVSDASPAAPSSSTAVPSTVPPETTSAGAFVLTDALTAAIQDEFHAEAVYRRVLLDFGNVMPFANIGARVLRDLVLTFDQATGRVRITRPAR